ncbi:MarR family winged helix-turn-helix transcriptional regulator [uncultured Cellulomonas sp.]|uniref:MarR family winged helix-turn-helix transcriptional regulator n=1 Tax=uncultured Cellulomonas sp. TaxID=189682 RepID=UPI00261D1F02|nr:MarR family transcriptional regulator [uncultured Cellulomonas sp.]
MTGPSPGARPGARTGNDAVDRVEGALGSLLRRARAASADVAARAHPTLDPGAYLLLAQVARSPEVRVSDLAAHVGVGSATISRQVTRLEADGMLMRRPHRADPRSRVIELTAQGREQLTRSQDARRTLLRAALASWPGDQQEELAAVLHRLNVTLHDDAGARGTARPTLHPDAPLAP